MADTPKLFTVDEANQLLAQVAPLIEQLQGLHRSIARTQQQLTDASDKVRAGNGYPIDDLRQQIRDLSKHELILVEAFRSAATQLESLGCIVKDLDEGLVDFYTVRDGQLIFLCWRQGEDRIAFWHAVEDGFHGRQPLE